MRVVVAASCGADVGYTLSSVTVVRPWVGSVTGMPTRATSGCDAIAAVSDGELARVGAPVAHDDHLQRPVVAGTEALREHVVGDPRRRADGSLPWSDEPSRIEKNGVATSTTMTSAPSAASSGRRDSKSAQRGQKPLVPVPTTLGPSPREAAALASAHAPSGR